MNMLVQDFWYIHGVSGIQVADKAFELDYPYLTVPQTGNRLFPRRKHAIKVAQSLGIEEDKVYHTSLRILVDS